MHGSRSWLLAAKKWKIKWPPKYKIAAKNEMASIKSKECKKRKIIKKSKNVENMKKVKMQKTFAPDISTWVLVF